MNDDMVDDEEDMLDSGLSGALIDHGLPRYLAWFADPRMLDLPDRLHACIDAATSAAELPHPAANPVIEVFARLNFLMCLAEYMPAILPRKSQLPQNIFFQIENLVTAYDLPPVLLEQDGRLLSGPTMNLVSNDKRAKRRALAGLDKRAVHVATGCAAAAAACVNGFIERHAAIAAAGEAFTPDPHISLNGTLNLGPGETGRVKKSDVLWQQPYLLSCCEASSALGDQLLALSSRRCEATGAPIAEGYLAAFFIRFDPNQRRDLVNRTLWPGAIHMVAADVAELVRQLRQEDANRLTETTLPPRPEGGFWRRYRARSSGLV